MAALAASDRDALLAMGSPRTYRAGRRIMAQGAVEDFVLALSTGWTTVSADADNGRSVIFGLCGPRDLIGEMAVFDGGPRSANVTALTDVSARLLTRGQFQSFLRGHPHAYEVLLRGMAIRLRAADVHSQDLATLPVLRRLARLLLDVDGEDPRSAAAARLTQNELAAAIGATRESVAKALADLRSRDVLRTVDRRIVVIDRPALAAIAAL
ncbi:Crp/Fnr family transcriptional regulator [Actinocrinis puniceicyclus]|uniref:Crp/Fnr family transcriptional regulator n=1 Tax=Actinocrinis puniceicyclus TaxID=977794 RepID=A0A8J7WN07_9ACTN|nr:Crp/Fnr family transcriptional regulator [Actinocrinis puniceicyclus]MBS2965371.1 Crp/Fnr family transcriptional regulator [Actinocrinis puniceicyclus]